MKKPNTMAALIKEVTKDFIKAMNKPKPKVIGKLITIDFKKGVRV